MKLAPRFRYDRDRRLQTSVVNDLGQQEIRYAFLVSKDHYEWLVWLHQHALPEDQAALSAIIEQLNHVREGKSDSWIEVRRVENRPWWSPRRWLRRTKIVWRGEFD